MTVRSGTKPSTYRAEIDGLRAIAVGAVIINHVDKNLLPGGHLGVDIFFVISGYVITTSLASSQFTGFGDFLSSFYLRRVKRILPALAVLVVISSLLICFVNPNPGLSLQTGLASLVGLSNLLLYKANTDYFAGSTQLNVFTHTWSLGVEEQFYLLFPFLFWFSGWGARKPAGLNRFLGAMALLMLLSILVFFRLGFSNPQAAFFLLPARFWELALGCLLCGLERRFQTIRTQSPVLELGRSAWVQWGSQAAWLSFVLMLLTLFFGAETSIAAPLVMVLSVAGLIAALAVNQRLRQLLSHPWLVAVGLMSYSLYLWHWVVLCLSRWTIGIHGWSVPFQLLLMVALAQASYRWIETPLRRRPWSVRPLASFLKAGLAIGGVAALVSLLAVPFKGRLFLGQSNTIQANYLSAPLASAEICNLFERPSVVHDLPTSCGFAPAAGGATVYVLGDSHMHQFRHSLAHYARLHGAGLVGVWGNACPFPDLPAHAFAHIPRKQTCIIAQKATALTLLKTIKPGDVVFIGNYLTAYFTPVGGGRHYEQARQDYARHLRQLADRLVGRGATVVLYLNGPRFAGLEGMSEGYCYPQWFKPVLSANCRIDAAAFLGKRLHDFGWIYQWADGKQRLVWDGVDPTTCQGGSCRAAHYKDEAHFLDYYAAYLAQKFFDQHPHLLAEPSGQARK